MNYFFEILNNIKNWFEKVCFSSPYRVLAFDSVLFSINSFSSLCLLTFLIFGQGIFYLNVVGFLNLYLAYKHYKEIKLAIHKFEEEN